LAAISCSSASLCLAVGGFGLTRATSHPYTEMWDGIAWRLLATPGPPHAHGLSGVSCATVTSCVAVGLAGFASPFADAWSGRSWRVLAMPSQQAIMNGISCPAAASCVSVGATPGLGGSAVADEWNGKTWQVLTVPAVPGALSSELASVSCVSRRSCIAVGSYRSNSVGNPVFTLAEEWDGTTWKLLATAASPADSNLSGISCASAVSCVAVGQNGGPPSALAERWDGHTWQVLAAASLPGAKSSSLSGVSCVSVLRCMATGGYVPAHGEQIFLAERWNGSAWQLTKTPEDPGEGPLGAVSCAAAASCMAVGIALAVQWNGSTWQARRTLRFDSLSGVSCTGPTRCMAVGSYVNAAGRRLTLAERWNGRSWRVIQPLTPAGVDNLASVSCVSATFCVAVATGPLEQSFAEKWDGRRWRMLAGLPDGVTSVSCATTTSCVAVGGPPGQFGRALAAIWNGRTWRILNVAGLGSGLTHLSDVSCVTATRCVAVGTYQPIGQGFDLTVAERWNGRTWRILAMPKARGGYDELAAVDCTSRAACVAVGSYFLPLAPPSVRHHDLAERWNGGTWRVMRTPGRYPVGAGLVGVSCQGATKCLAVGSYSLVPSGALLQVAANWSGGRWHPVRTPARAGALSTISCTATRCVAVGQAGGLNIRALAESWNGQSLRPMKIRNP
jgi:hypothetical protein